MGKRAAEPKEVGGGAARAKAQRWEVPESGEKGKRRQRVRQSRKDGAAQSRGSAPGCS